jgi:hypothetical protein
MLGSIIGCGLLHSSIGQCRCCLPTCLMSTWCYACVVHVNCALVPAVPVVCLRMGCMCCRGLPSKLCGIHSHRLSGAEAGGWCVTLGGGVLTPPQVPCRWKGRAQITITSCCCALSLLYILGEPVQLCHDGVLPHVCLVSLWGVVCAGLILQSFVDFC